MPVADPVSVASPSEGHRVAAPGNEAQAGQDGVDEKSKGHRQGVTFADVVAGLEEANRPGTETMAQFHRAPAATRTAFWAEVRKRTEAQRLVSRRREAEAVETGFDFTDYCACVLLAEAGNLWREGARRIWNQRWRDRAYRDRAIEERGRIVDDGFDGEKGRLLNLEAIDYVFRLTGVEANHGGYLLCPLPTHDERTPSFQCRDTRWRCYGCEAYGSIYELAGILWDLPRSGADFRRIHERLLEVFP
jgi:hypothetical protein